MGRIDDIDDNIENMGDDAQRVVENLLGTVQDQEDAIGQIQDNLYILSQREIHELYREEDIPYETARRFEENVDAELKGAGLRPYFENLPEDERPSEMYDASEPEPQGIFEKIGYAILE